MQPISSAPLATTPDPLAHRDDRRLFKRRYSAFFKYALAYLLRGARHALHDILLLRTSAIRRRLYLGRRLDSHQDEFVLLATYRGGSLISFQDKEARKSDDLIKRDFTANKPLEKCITDMTEIKASDGKLYVSAIFDCYDLAVLGLAMDTNMKATLCEQTLDNACKAYPMLRGAILHSDRGTQYTSELYRKSINKYGILQSMNSAGGRCHDNARCESIWARFKEELFYGRYDTTSMTVEQLKTLIWRYFVSYWNNRRICSANGGLPPMVKRQQYYDSLQDAA